jgi:hypothetical protein
VPAVRQAVSFAAIQSANRLLTPRTVVARHEQPRAHPHQSLRFVAAWVAWVPLLLRELVDPKQSEERRERGR